MDALRPPFDVQELPEGPPNTAGGFDLFEQEQFVKPWHDQKMRRLEHYPISFTSSASQVVEIPEVPMWYLFCLQLAWAATPSLSNVLNDFVVTIKQGQGDTIDLRLPGGFQANYNGISVDYQLLYTPVRRYITKAESRQITLSTVAVNAAAVNVKGNLYLVGAGVDPTKVGEF